MNHYGAINNNIDILSPIRQAKQQLQQQQHVMLSSL